MLTPAMAGQRQPRSGVRRRLPRQPLPRGARVRRHRARAQPAHAHQPRAEVPRHRRPGRPQRRARRVPLLLGHLGHQGAHARSAATAATSAATGWPTASRAATRRTTRCSTATTRPSETTYVSRNRQLSAFTQLRPGRQAQLHGQARAGPVRDEDRRLDTSACRFNYKDFTDIRTGEAYTLQRQPAAAVRDGHLLISKEPAPCRSSIVSTGRSPRASCSRWRPCTAPPRRPLPAACGSGIGAARPPPRRPRRPARPRRARSTAASRRSRAT